MKKNIFFSLTFLFAVHCQLVKAQINTMRQPTQSVKKAELKLPNQNNTPQNNPPQNSMQQKSMQQNTIRQIIPAKGNIHPLKLVNNFSLMQSNKPKNLFALHTNNTALTKSQGNLHPVTNQISSAQMAYKFLNPSVTKIVGTNKITYTLKKSDAITTWKEGAEIQPKQMGSPGADSYNPDNGMNCHPVTLTFNCQSKTFMNAQPKSQGAALLPGLAYTYEDISNGNLTHHVLDNNRYPISISVDAVTQGSPVVDVSNPNINTIREAINTLRNGFGGNPGAAGGSDALYQITKTENLAEQSLAINAGGSYGTVSLKGSYAQTDSKYHQYYTIDAIKEMFTVTPSSDSISIYPANYEPPTNGGFPVMIGPVVYGARVLANMDITFEKSSNTGGLQFEYQGVGASAFADIKAAIASKKVTVSINGMLVGFPQKFPGTFSTNSIDDFLSTVNNFFTGCDYTSAEPIQYTLIDLEGNEMGIQSFTDKTTIQECTPANEHFVLKSVMGKIASGDDAKNDNSEFWLSVAAGTPNNPKWSGQFYDNKQEFKKEGNDHYIELKNISPTLLEDFQKGGFVALKLIEHGHTGDDWDFTTLTLNFNFVSEHGLTKTIPLVLTSFRISASNNDKNYLFHSTGSDSFILQ